MPRCYTPPITPSSSPKSPRTRALSHVVESNGNSAKCAEEAAFSNGPTTTVPRLPLANHPVPLLDIPWNGFEPHPAPSKSDNDTEVLNMLLLEIQEMLRSNFDRIHLHNASLLKRIKSKSPQIRLEADFPSKEETSAQPGILVRSPSFQNSGSSTKLAVSNRPKEAMKLQRAASKDESAVQSDSPTRPSELTSRSAAMSLRRMGSQFRDMEKLADIISRHSKLHKRRSRAAQQTWVFFENRSSSKWAYFYGSIFAPFFLVLSVMISFLQTVDGWKMPEDTSSAIQSGFEIWFAIEIAIRFAVCPAKKTFWQSGFNMIDLISVIPLFIRLYVWIVLQQCTCDNDIVHRVLSLVPMLRLLKILRRFHKFQLLLSAFYIAVEALPVLIFSLCLLAIFFSGLIFLIESRDLIPSLPSAMWFVIVTMTTVGYGDVVPQTTPGKVVTVVLMISSALYMALPIGIVGTAFSEVWKDRDRLLLISVLRESFAISGVSRQLIKEMFHEFSDGAQSDDDSNPCADPEMNVEQFLRMLRALQIDVTEARATALFQALDVDNGGTITCDEFIKRLFPYAYLANKRKSTSRRSKSWNSLFSGDKMDRADSLGSGRSGGPAEQEMHAVRV